MVWRCTNPLSRLGGGAQDGHMCPLCGENIPGAADELIAHVDVCMQGVSVEVKVTILSLRCLNCEVDIIHPRGFLICIHFNIFNFVRKWHK